MATIATFRNYQKKKFAFLVWKNYIDTLQKEAYRSKLEEYESDPRYANVQKNLSRMLKAELAEAAEKECNLTHTAANGLTCHALRGLLRMKRQGDQAAMDPMMRKPKGLSQMNKETLITNAKSRSLTVDVINDKKREWKQLTREELILAIEDHVNYLNGRETVILKNHPSVIMNESSSDLEFMDVRVEEQESGLSHGGRRKRDSQTSRTR